MQQQLEQALSQLGLSLNLHFDNCVVCHSWQPGVSCLAHVNEYEHQEAMASICGQIKTWFLSAASASAQEGRRTGCGHLQQSY